MNRGLGFLFVVVLAMSMIGYSGSSANAPVARPEAGSAGDTTAPPNLLAYPERCKASLDLSCPNCGPFCPAQPLLDTIRDFFPAPSANQGSGDHLGVPQGAYCTVQSIIAIVPDPVHTHLALFFDSSIDAIEQAAQRARYDFDRAIMPWDYTSHPEPTDFVMRLRQAEYAKNKEQLPGLMIFRQANPKLHAQPQATAAPVAPLFVFVVSETPTGGIRKEQFRNAVRAITKIRGEDCGHTIPLSIVGPTFSGSLFSLVQLLDERKDLQKPVMVHSGTASSWQTIDWFEGQTKDSVRFTTFQESDRYAARRFIRFATTQGYDLARIAVLSEEETAYGSALFEHVEKIAPQLTKEQEKEQQEVINIEKKVVQLYFPREISQLRTAYQRDLRGDESADASGHRPSRSTLRLNLEDTGSDEDSVPPYSHQQTPLSQEAVLLGIVTNLQKHASQFVIIRATNPLDQLFLARYLRVAYPEGRIVTSGSDMLFRREVDNNLLQGTLAITSYSLVPGADDVTSYARNPDGSPRDNCRGCVKPKDKPPSPHADYVFPNSYSSGTYNATLSLLKCLEAEISTAANNKESAGEAAKDRAACSSNQLPVEHYAEYGWPDIGGVEDPASSVLAPPLQLTVLGRYGYWRLALLDGRPYTKEPMQTKSNLHAIQGNAVKVCFKTDVPQPWKLLCGIFSGIVITLLAFLWRGSIWSPSEAMANLAPLPDRSRQTILGLGGLLLLGALLLLAGPWIRWWGVLSSCWWFFWILALWVVLLFRWMIEYKHREIPDGKSTAVHRWAFLGLSVVMLVGACWFYLGGDPAQRNLMLYRYIQLASGLSPVLPWLLLIAALLWWAWYSLAGVALLDQRRPHLPTKEDLFPMEERDVAANLSDTKGVKQLGRKHLTEEANEKLLDIGRPFSWDPRIYLPVTLIGLIAWMIVDHEHPVQSLEGSTFDILYAVAFGLVILWLLATLLRLAVTWLECRRLLIALDCIPLRRSFRWLTGFSWKPIWRVRGSVLQDSFRILERQMDSLRNLSNVLADKRKREAEQQQTSDTQASGKEPVTPLALLEERRNAVEFDYSAAVKAKTPLESFLDKFKRPAGPETSKTAAGPVTSQTGSSAPNSGLTLAELTKKLTCSFESLQITLAQSCAWALDFLSVQWAGETGTQVSSDSGAKKAPKQGSGCECHAPNPEDKAREELALETRLAEEFVCLVYVNFILSVLMRMRSLVMAAVGMFVFLLLSIGCYPFEPKQAMYSMLILVFLLIVVFVAFVYAQMHRDSTLSHITDTTPGELGLDFWIRLAGFTAVPLLSLFLAQFPAVNNFLFSWLEPALQGWR
jgi:hypothetical protein